MQRDTAFTTARYVGWLVLAAAIAEWRILFVPLTYLQVGASTWIPTSLMIFPVWICAVIGAIDLIRRRTLGFYFVYASLALSIFGWKLPFPPLITHFLPNKDWSWLMFTINLFVVTLLLFCHYSLRHTKKIKKT